MKTLLLAHRETSSFFITLLVIVIFCLACGSFYKSTHHFSQRGNAPITLKILPNQVLKQVPKTAPKATPKTPSKPKVSKIKTPSKIAKPTIKKQIKQEQMKQEVPTQKTQAESQQKPQEMTQTSNTQETKQEVSEEKQESIELIASVQGEHFELYNQVHGAILKNVFYPKKARYKRLTGVVVVEFVLEKNGSITQERVIQSSGYALLDESAIKALNSTQFPTTPKRYRFRVPLRYG